MSASGGIREHMRRAADSYALDADLGDYLMLGFTVVTAPAWLPFYLLGRLAVWAVRRPRDG